MGNLEPYSFLNDCYESKYDLPQDSSSKLLGSYFNLGVVEYSGL